MWGWGQRIREDGPHTHLEKMGTPTMGGIVIVLGAASCYLATRITSGAPTPAGLALLFAAVGFGVVGFFDDYLKVRPPSLPRPRRSPRSSWGPAIVSVLFARRSSRTSRRNGDGHDLSFIRDTGLELGVFFLVWCFRVLTASSHAVNLTDGLDGLAAGSSILVLSAYIFIAFWQFRHRASGWVRPDGVLRR